MKISKSEYKGGNGNPSDTVKTRNHVRKPKTILARPERKRILRGPGGLQGSLGGLIRGCGSGRERESDAEYDIQFHHSLLKAIQGIRHVVPDQPLKTQLNDIYAKSRQAITSTDALHNKKDNKIARKQQQLINKAPKKSHKEISRGKNAQPRESLQAVKDPETGKIETEPTKIAQIFEKYLKTPGKLSTFNTAPASFECIKTLSNNKSPGPDGIVNELLDLCYPQKSRKLYTCSSLLCGQLAHAKSLENQQYYTKLVPIDKNKGDETEASSYRPIGLANILYNYGRVSSQTLSTIMQKQTPYSAPHKLAFANKKNHSPA